MPRGLLTCTTGSCLAGEAVLCGETVVRRNAGGSTLVEWETSGAFPVALWPDWTKDNTGNRCVSTAKVADKPTGKVVGEPERGELDFRFDEGAEGRKGMG